MTDIREHLHQDFQKITKVILNRVGKLSQKALFDVVLRRMLFPDGTSDGLADLTSAYFPTDCAVSYVSGDRSVGAVLKVSKGLGFKRDDSETNDDEPFVKPIHVEVDTNLSALDPSDSTNPRIDRIYARPLLVAENQQSVDIIDPSDESVSSQNLNQDNRRAFETVVATGTPAASPSLPPNPSGWTDSDEIARVTVQPGAGSISASDIEDRRLTFFVRDDLIDSIAASLITVAAPLADGDVQAALERIDAKPNPAAHASTHTGSGTDRLPFLIREIRYQGGDFVQGVNLQQIFDFSGRGGDSRVLLLCLYRGRAIGSSGQLRFTVTIQAQGVTVGAGSEIELQKSSTPAFQVGNFAAAYLQNVPALSGRTFHVNVNIVSKSSASDILDGIFLVVDLGRV